MKLYFLFLLPFAKTKAKTVIERKKSNPGVSDEELEVEIWVSLLRPSFNNQASSPPAPLDPVLPARTKFPSEIKDEVQKPR
ncbi:MAG: hypothetical protein ACW99F_13340 [Candidatus Hodarchaeales archaeon]